MRGGILLAEEPPTKLMLMHNCSNLEEAFLELSKKQTNSEDDDMKVSCNIFRFTSIEKFLIITLFNSLWLY